VGAAPQRRRARARRRVGIGDPPAEGELHPILIDALGDPVVAAWTPPSGDRRWYDIPDATDWNNVLDWLVHRALPE